MPPGQEDLDASNVLHVKSCPYLPGTANRYSISSRSSRLSLKHISNDVQEENVENEENNSDNNSTGNLNTNNMNNESKLDFNINISPSSNLANKSDKTASYHFSPSKTSEEHKSYKADQRSFNDFEVNSRNGGKTSNYLDALDHHHHNQLLLYHQQPEYHEYQKPRQHHNTHQHDHHEPSPASSSSPVYHGMMCHPHFMPHHQQQPPSRHPSSSCCTEASSIHDSQDLTPYDVQLGLRKRQSFKQRILPSKKEKNRSRELEEDEDDDLFRSPSLVISMMANARHTPASSSVMSVSGRFTPGITGGFSGGNSIRQAWKMESNPLGSKNNIDFDCDYTSSSHDSNVNSTLEAMIHGNSKNEKYQLQTTSSSTISTITSTTTSTANNNNDLNNKNNTATANNIASEANRVEIPC